MPKIYISHRPEDSSRNDIRQIKQCLIEEFGEDNLIDTASDHMDTTLERQAMVKSCDVMLIVIGQYWLDMVDEQGNNLLDDPIDPVHIEIDAGLTSTPTVALLVVDGASLPKLQDLPTALKPLLNKPAIDDITDIAKMLDNLRNQHQIADKSIVDLQNPTKNGDDSKVLDIPYKKKGRPTYRTTVSIFIGFGLIASGIIFVMFMWFEGQLQDNVQTYPEADTLELSDNTATPELTYLRINSDNISQLQIIDTIEIEEGEEIISVRGSYSSGRYWTRYITRDSLDNYFSCRHIKSYYRPQESSSKYCDYMDQNELIKLDSPFITELDLPSLHTAYLFHDVGLIVTMESGEWVLKRNNISDLTTQQFIPPDIETQEINLYEDPHGNNLLIQINNQLQLWNPVTLELNAIADYDSDFQFIKYTSTDATNIMVVTEDKLIHYLNPLTLETRNNSILLQTLSQQVFTPIIHGVSRDGLMILQSAPMTLQFWDLEHEALLHEMNFDIQIRQSQFSSDERFILVADRSRILILSS